MSDKKEMSLKEKEASVLKWNAVTLSYLNEVEKLIQLVGASVESPLLTALYTLYDEYTGSVQRELNDEFKWLDWYVWDNEMGAKKLEASIGGKFISVCSIQDLMRVMFD